MSGKEMIAILNDKRDIAMDGDLRPYIHEPVEVVKECKSGLYLIRTLDGFEFSVPKANLVITQEARNRV